MGQAVYVNACMDWSSLQIWNTDEKVAYQQVLFEVQVSLEAIIPLFLTVDRKDPRAISV